MVGHRPERVTTNGHDSYPRAIRETFGSDVLHRTNRYLNKGDGKNQMIHYDKRIPPAIPKLRESSAGVNRQTNQAGTV